MKKLIMGIAMLVAYADSNAQFYLQGGLNLANITKTNEGHTEKNKYRTLSLSVGIPLN
jgi:hypothetical protein